MCFLNPLAKIEAKELYTAYSRWCDDEGEIALKNRTFYRLLENKSIHKKRGAKNKTFLNGIGLQKESYKYLQKEDESVTPSNPEKHSVTPFKLS
ncbi:hypothetical protein BK704_01170 [[Bacillus thuringiensis] serovar konkukian]|nr:hypothetical protein BK704_28930 [[Bacillus thuringiensis] serovar konkukian]OUB18515.1 hypothetical protein BK704_01170 [[Bacillus thuringiensis] serovar konkukian]